MVFDVSSTDASIHANLNAEFSVKPEDGDVQITAENGITCTEKLDGTYDIVIPAETAAADKKIDITVKGRTYTVLFESLGAKWTKVTADVDQSASTLDVSSDKSSLVNSTSLSEVNGAGDVALDITLVADTNNIDPTDQAEIESQVSGDLQFVDLQVVKTVTVNAGVPSIQSIHNTASPLKVRIGIPEKYQGDGYSVEVFRMHNRILSKLDTKKVNNGKEVEFESDLYSTYALKFELVGGGIPPANTDNKENETPLVYDKSNADSITATLSSTKDVTGVEFANAALDASAYEIKDGKLILNKESFADLKEGNYTLVVTYSDKSTETYTINVVAYDTANTITDVPVFYMTKNMSKGNSFTLTLTGIKDNASVSYKSSNTKVATVSKNGVIKAKANGKATVTAVITQKGSQYKVKIRIKVAAGNPFNRTISEKDAISVNTGLPVLNIYKKIKIGNRTKLQINNIAEDAVVSYASSDKSIAAVSKAGTIIAKAAGECVVTAKIKQNDKTYCYKVLVRVPEAK